VEQVFEILADVYKRGRLDAFSDASEVESSTPLLEGSATRIQLNSYEGTPRREVSVSINMGTAVPFAASTSGSSTDSSQKDIFMLTI